MTLFGFLKRPQVGGIIKAIGLDSWYEDLSENQKFKLKEYSRRGQGLIEGEIWTDQTPKHFLWTTALNANHMRDFAFGVWLAQEGLNAKGSMGDQHFLYNALIEAYDRMDDHESMIKICWEEVRCFRKIRPDLEKDFRGKIPPSIPCRDKLVDWASSNLKTSEEFESLFSSLVENEVMTREEADSSREELEIEHLHDQAESYLESNDFPRAKAIFDAILAKDDTDAAEIDKRLGNFFLENSNLPEAMGYFQSALKKDPLIAGVKTKLQKIAKSLSVEVKEDTSEAIAALRRKSISASEWWEKRDVADECVKFGEFDLAGNLFQEALSLRIKSGAPADTIYSHMAKMHERKKDYPEAITCFLLSYRELNRGGLTEPPKLVTQGLERGLKKTGLTSTFAQDLYLLADSSKTPEEIRSEVRRVLGTKTSR